MKLNAVIGGNYGDEGKGLITDYLSSLNSSTLVIRFNGGAQAGHTVVTPQNQRHVFHLLSSGSFAGADTFLSQHCLFDPRMLVEECQIYQRARGKMPSVFVHPHCVVTTPCDLLINQYLEYQRGEQRHGSCGLGIGEAIGRHTQTNHQLFVSDLLDLDRCYEKLESMRCHWIPERLSELGLSFHQNDKMARDFFTAISSNGLTRWFLEDIKKSVHLINITNESLLLDRYQSWVFEGAQGLLLDQNYGEFPHVTRSNTGLKNIKTLLSQLPDYETYELDVYYVTRAYLTRHGAGPLAHELKTAPYEKINDPTNIRNEFQGHLRFAYLNLDLLKQAIDTDIDTNKELNIRKNLALTCLDQLDSNVRFYAHDSLHTVHQDDFPQIVAEFLEVKNLLLSYGPSRETIKTENSLSRPN